MAIAISVIIRVTALMTIRQIAKADTDCSATYRHCLLYLSNIRYIIFIPLLILANTRRFILSVFPLNLFKRKCAARCLEYARWRFLHGSSNRLLRVDNSFDTCCRRFWSNNKQPTKIQTYSCCFSGPAPRKPQKMLFSLPLSRTLGFRFTLCHTINMLRHIY